MWCELDGYIPADVFVDAGISGKRADNRPGLRQAVGIRRGPENPQGGCISSLIDLNRERCIREHTRAIRKLMVDDPDLATRTLAYLEQCAMTEQPVLSMRLPADLVARIDHLCQEHPELVKVEGGTGRVTRNAAIRLLLERSLKDMEKETGKDKK